jgi:hypothetical protein
MIAVGRRKARIPSHALVRLGAAVVFAALAASAAAQNQPSEEAPPPAATAEPQPQSKPPEVLGAIGRWVGESIATVKSGLGSIRGGVGDLGEQAGDAARDTAGAAQDAATGIVRIPTTGIVAGRQQCVRAPNGGPDCRAATQALCQSKGYAGGRSLDVQSAQKCPAWVLLSGRQPMEGECSMETYVTRAVCQ